MSYNYRFPCLSNLSNAKVLEYRCHLLFTATFLAPTRLAFAKGTIWKMDPTRYEAKMHSGEVLEPSQLMPASLGMLQTHLGLAYSQQRASIFCSLTPTPIWNLRADSNTSKKGVPEARGCLPISPSCPLFRLRGSRIAPTLSFFERLAVWGQLSWHPKSISNPPNACRLPFQTGFWDLYNTLLVLSIYFLFVTVCVCLGVYIYVPGSQWCKRMQIPWSWNHKVL